MAVLEICKKDDQLAKADYRTIWRKLYLDGISKAKLARPQYRVVDALDECKNDSDLVPLLLKISTMLNIPILVTSRTSFGSFGPLKSSKTELISEEISEDDTSLDI